MSITYICNYLIIKCDKSWTLQAKSSALERLNICSPEENILKFIYK